MKPFLPLVSAQTNTPVSSHLSSYISLNLSCFLCFPSCLVPTCIPTPLPLFVLCCSISSLLTSLFYFSLPCFLSLQFLFSCVLFLSGRFHVSSSFSIVDDDVSFTAWFASFSLLSTYHFPCHFLFQCFSLSFLSCLISICVLIISLFLLCFLSHFLLFFMFPLPFPVSYSVSSAVSASVSSPISCSFLHYVLLFPVSFLVWYELTSAVDVRACSPHCVLNVNELDEGLLTLSLGAVFDGWMRRRVSGVGSFVWSDILLFHWQLLQFDRDRTRDLFQSRQVLVSSSGRRKRRTIRRRLSSPTPAADGG